MKVGALQLSLDRLQLSLAKATEAEASWKEKAQGLVASLSESSSSATLAQEKLLQLQKALTASEHDRRVLQVRELGGGLSQLPPGEPLGICPAPFEQAMCFFMP